MRFSRKFRIFLIVLLSAAALFAGLTYFAYKYLDLCVDSEGSEVVFAVDKGESLTDIAHRLEEAGLIKSALYMRILAKFDETGGSFKSGLYSLSSAMTTREIKDRIVSGAGINIKVTIPEGITLKKAAEIFEKSGVVRVEDFLAAACDLDFLDRYGVSGLNAQGYIFPDSYLFQQGTSAYDVLAAILDNFYRKMDDFVPEYKAMSRDEIHRRMTLASIVEREYRVASEAPLMASVFYNRIDCGMSLSSCATVEYVLTDELGRAHPRYLTYDDLKIESPYNTYIHKELPPGPICSPGLVAISAAFRPAQTDYLYFLLKNPETGEHCFSNRYSEHVHAKQIYLKSR